jgi:hypothetical protein
MFDFTLYLPLTEQYCVGVFHWAVIGDRYKVLGDQTYFGIEKSK